MATFRRDRTPGATYFFTVVTHRREPLLLRPPLLLALREAVHRVRRDNPFEIVAWVTMPDHIHCIWTLPTGDADFPSRWSMIKRLASQALDARGSVSGTQAKRREAGLWQPRFWEHRILDEKDLEAHVDYIHWNPVKHGCVTRPVEWKYSTIHRYIRRGLLPADWGIGGEPRGQFGE
jgi:putative transposase